MSEIVPPIKGHGISVNWGTAVTASVNRHERAISARVGETYKNSREPVARPYPFKAIGGTDDGNAKITLYVPQGALIVADEELAPDEIDGISSVDGCPDYYTVDSLDDLATTADDAQPLYLVVWRDEKQTDPVTAATVTMDPSTITGTVMIQATIALVWASTPENSSNTYGAVAEQIVRSAVHVGRGSGGSSTSTAAEEFLFPYKLKLIGRRLCIYLPGSELCIGGAYVTISAGNEVQKDWHDVANNNQYRYVYLRVTSGTNGFEASIGLSAVNGAAWNIIIGMMDSVGSTGSQTNTITQYVVGAIFLPGASSPTGGQQQNTVLKDVVTDVAYSESTHKLTQTKEKLTVLGVSTADTYNGTVFEAADHQNEHGNS